MLDTALPSRESTLCAIAPMSQFNMRVPAGCPLFLPGYKILEKECWSCGRCVGSSWGLLAFYGSPDQCEVFHSWSLSYKCRRALASPGLHQEMGQDLLPEGLHWVISVGGSLRGQCALGFVTLGEIPDLTEPQLPHL